MPPGPRALSASRAAVSRAAPSTPSIAISKGFGFFMPPCSSPRSGQGQPLGDRVDVPRRPRALLACQKQLADLAVLIADRLFGVDGDEVEDQRQRLVLPDHAS